MAGQFHFDPSTYDELMRSEVPGYMRLQAAVAEAASAVRATRVLELGTGTGATLRRVVPHSPNASYIGIDESDSMLSYAREAVPGADLRVALLQDPLPEGEFDLVFSALAVHHLDGDEKADLFRRVAAQLAPGGRFVLGDLIVPDDPADIVTEIEDDYDKPSSATDQLRWLADAGLTPTVAWREKDLAVLVADRPSRVGSP
jgi:cyclopropane fatty-acyl-phospholipid synthase-like methyltransferase